MFKWVRVGNMEIKLKSCPFCGCQEIFHAEIPTKKGRTYKIICSHCGAMTGRKKTEEKAIAAWEKRYDMK